MVKLSMVRIEEVMLLLLVLPREKRLLSEKKSAWTRKTKMLISRLMGIYARGAEVIPSPVAATFGLASQGPSVG